jgi:hypothetical protein
VAKNDLFELMMLFNKDRFLQGFAANRRREATFDHIKQNMYAPPHPARSTSPPSRNAKTSRSTSTRTT